MEYKYILSAQRFALPACVFRQDFDGLNHLLNNRAGVDNAWEQEKPEASLSWCSPREKCSKIAEPPTKPPHALLLVYNKWSVADVSQEVAELVGDDVRRPSVGPRRDHRPAPGRAVENTLFRGHYLGA